MTADKDRKARMNWLDEHESIQLDLLKMKEDLVKVEDEEPIREEEPSEPVRSDETEKSIPEDHMEIPRLGTISMEASEPQTTESGNDERERAKNEAPRLPKGRIPTSPDLTNKIASVIQLENKLKRRKYEMERKERLERESREKKKEPDQVNKAPVETKEAPSRVVAIEMKKDPRPEQPVKPVQPVVQAPIQPPIAPPQLNVSPDPIEPTTPAPAQSVPRKPGDQQPGAVRRRMIVRRRGQAPDPGPNHRNTAPPPAPREPGKKVEDERSSEGKFPGRSIRSISRFFRKGND